jgi:quinol monooxygenase YgiN
VIQLVLKIVARPKGLEGMVQALGQVMFEAKLEPNCVDCQVYTEAANPLSLLYLERWATQQDLDAQLRSQRLGTLLSIMETAPVAPTLEISTVSEPRGLGYIEAVRLGTDGRGAQHRISES